VKGAVSSMYNNQITFSLLTNNGNDITEYSKDGLTFVEGRKGSEYKIKVYNQSSYKIKAILSVDGLDIISGKRADGNSKGYVINPYSVLIIDGWRINNDEVRKFFFTKSKNTYNAKTGNDTNNLGVIGLMVFKEKYIPQVILGGGYYPKYTFDSYYNSVSYPVVGHSGLAIGSAQLYNCATPTSSIEKLSKSAGSLRSASVGTGMGEKTQSKVQEVNVEFESVPFSKQVIYYKTKKELEALGVIVTKTVTNLPSPFAGYCKEV
jgi:hypothetical protein